MSDEEVLHLLKYYLLIIKDVTKPRNLYKLCKLTGLTEKEVLINMRDLLKSGNLNSALFYENFKFKEKTKQEVKVHQFNVAKKRFQICFTSDKHIGHAFDDIESVHTIYDEAEKRGVDLIFDLGDLLNGPKRKAKYKNDIRIGTLNDSLIETNEFHQSKIPTYFITGNHDLGFMKSNLCDIGKVIEEECDNLYFLNDLFAPLEINGLKINISHGYVEQKYLRFINLQNNNKFLTINNPDLIMQGHFHVYSLCKQNGKFLYQIPSLKYNNKSTKNFSLNQECRVGAVFLTVEKFNDLYEIRTETMDLQKPKRLSKVIEHSYER